MTTFTGTFQRVRGAMEKLTSHALTTGIVIDNVLYNVPSADQAFDNVQETPSKDPSGTYATINISFPQTVIQTVGCEGADAIVGSCNVLLYTPKREGMMRAENIMQVVLKAWVGENSKLMPPKPAPNAIVTSLRVRNINGPNTLAPDQRPHQVTQLSCAFTAIVQENPTT